MAAHPSLPLAGASIVITRPVGGGAALARRARALGAHTLRLPGVSLQATVEPAAARAALHAAMHDDLAIFTSPAAVRFGARLLTLKPTRGCLVCAVGKGTARALHRHGVVEVVVPRQRWNSEGLLAHPVLAQVDGRSVALIGAPGGRGLLARELRSRGARVHAVEVYRRVPARLDRRHFDVLQQLGGSCLVLLSSSETLDCLHMALPDRAWDKLVSFTAVVSSERLARAARAAGFSDVVVARSAMDADLLDAARHRHEPHATPGWHGVSQKG